MKHRREQLGHRLRAARHLQRDIETFLHPQLLHCSRQVAAPDIEGVDVPRHLFRQTEAIGIDVGDDDVTRAGVTRDRRRHATDRTGAGDEHVFAHEIKGERGMRRVAERIETGKHIERNARIGLPDVRLRDGEKFRKRALPVDPDPFRVRAEMAPTGKTITAMPTNDVSLAGHEIARRKPFHPAADPLDDSDVLVPDHHRDRDRLLRPGIPVVNVNISPADRGLFDSDENIIVADLRHGHLFEPQARLRFALHQGLHRLLHAAK